MARPKKDESIKRTKNVMVRFTDVEYALVSCSAEQAGYPVAVYVRKQAITEKLHVHYNIVADIAELRDFARQLSHIGNTLSWEHRGITHTVMGNIPYDEIMKIAEGIR